MRTLLTPLLLICSITAFLACGNNKTESDHEETQPSQEGAKPEKLLNKVSFNKSEGVVIITYYTSSTDWEAIKTALVEQKNGLDEDVKTYTLICYNELTNTPDVIINPDAAWDKYYNSYRVCALDNQLMTIRFCHTVRTDAGSEGDWEHIELYDEETQTWKMNE